MIIVFTKLGEQLTLSEVDGKTSVHLSQCGKTTTITHSLDVVRAGLSRWHSGERIQDAMAFMCADDREIFMTGSLGLEFFGEEDEL